MTSTFYTIPFASFRSTVWPVEERKTGKRMVTCAPSLAIPSEIPHTFRTAFRGLDSIRIGGTEQYQDIEDDYPVLLNALDSLGIVVHRDGDDRVSDLVILPAGQDPSADLLKTDDTMFVYLGACLQQEPFSDGHPCATLHVFDLIHRRHPVRLAVFSILHHGGNLARFIDRVIAISFLLGARATYRRLPMVQST